MHHKHLKQTRADVVFDIVSNAFLIFALVVTLFPLIFVISASVSDPTAVYRGEVWLLPKGFSLEGYRRVFQDPAILTGYLNSIIYTVVSTAITLVTTIPCAYAVSRRDFRGGSILMGFFTLTMFLSGGTIPSYLLIKNLGMLDTMWALVLPGAVSAYNIIIARTFFQSTIPTELLEAAQIDGCGNTKFFFSIVLPLAKPIMAVIGLFAAVGMWNQYFNAMMYLSDRAKYPLQNILREILIQTEVNTSMFSDVKALAEQQRVSEVIKYALIIVATVPMMIIYPFVQKHFVKGVMIGSIKG